LSIGKLHRVDDEQFAAGIDYRFHAELATDWWGEFILTEYKKLPDGERYVIELEDGRKGRCSIQRRLNRAVIGVPPLYRYYFRGKELLK